MLKLYSAILLLAVFISTAQASRTGFRLPRPSMPKFPGPDGPFTDVSGNVLPPLNTTYYFDQLIDHNNPSLGTFKQRYWHTWEFYQPGGAIILCTPGESNAEGYEPYLTNASINGQIAQQENGATIIFEHRFFGLSNPYPDLSEESFRVLNIQQAIDDLVYFANNVVLPMPGGGNVKPDTTPWILLGGSYSAALTAWTMTNKPGVFAAGYASSAVVEAIVDFWRYFEPIREAMPQNCSADVQAVAASIDALSLSNNFTAVNFLKDALQLGELTHFDDVASAFIAPLGYWQSTSPSTGPNGRFFEFCDALEVKDGVSAPASGWGVLHAAKAWGGFFKGTMMGDFCGDEDVLECFGTYDATQSEWTDISIDNEFRSWQWFVCNEVGWFQGGAPVGHPTLSPRLVTVEYFERQCSLLFPKTFPKPPQVNVDPTNKKYKGWSTNINRFFFANGHRDPWRDATMSAETQNIASTPQQVIAISDGFHCNDLKTINGDLDPTVKAVQNQALASMKRWIQQWKDERTAAVTKRSPKWSRRDDH